MAEQHEDALTRVGKLPKELIGVACPRCNFRISQETEVSYSRDERDFVGYTLTCPECGNHFNYTLYMT